MVLKSEKDTQKLAKRVADEVLSALPKDGAMVLALAGDLGSGKTTFAQFFAKALGIADRILSPTFLIFRRYALNDKFFTSFYHVDVYRIKEAKELDVLNFKNILKDRRNIVLIEWADKIKEIIPQGARWFNFHHGESENERTVDFVG